MLRDLLRAEGFSVFPLYGDLYERFWRDEYHYVLFPLYGRTVKRDNDPKLSVSFLFDHTWRKRARFSVLAGLSELSQGGGLQQTLFSVAVLYAGTE